MRLEYLDPTEVLEIVSIQGPLCAEAAKELAIRAGAVIARPPRPRRARSAATPSVNSGMHWASG